MRRTKMIELEYSLMIEATEEPDVRGLNVPATHAKRWSEDIT